MIREIQRISELQPQHSSENTPAMQERGQLIRNGLPDLLRNYLPVFKTSIGRFRDELEIEGRDGTGRKTVAPWVRLYSSILSPRATTGFYVVIHFALDGKKFFVTVGCSATRWDSERGDLIAYSDEEMAKKIGWAKSVISDTGTDTSDFPDTIAIGATNSLAKSFEKATILAKALNPKTVEMDELISTINSSLRILAVIYEAHSQGPDFNSESIELNLQATVNPVKSRRGQGYGLTTLERRAVEFYAMKITRTHLEKEGYDVEAKYLGNPFDFLAVKDGQATKVEVKGTTSVYVDSILMTSNEVNLHKTEAGQTALAIVSGIKFLERGDNPRCDGGRLEMLWKWKIQEWQMNAKAFEVVRPRNNER